MANPFLKVQGFVTEVWAELKKSSWPTRQELVDSTIVVIVTVLILGRTVSGSMSWFNLGSLRLQPSEFTKITEPAESM